MITLKITLFQISKCILGLGKNFFRFTQTVIKIFKPRKEQTSKRRGLLKIKAVQTVHIKVTWESQLTTELQEKNIES